MNARRQPPPPLPVREIGEPVITPEAVRAWLEVVRRARLHPPIQETPCATTYASNATTH